MTTSSVIDDHETLPIRCSIVRGGTSRAVFFLAEDLPADRAAIAPILLDAMGSPDIRQINGLGGATSQTSKVAIIGPPTRPDADVDYTFAQVSITAPLVDWGGNCGNISSAVGPFAVNAGLVPTDGDNAVVRVHNVNTGKIIVARFPVVAGRAAILGDCAIPGVPGTGARIELEFTHPAGSVTGTLLPTGQPQETVEIADGRSFRVSVVDAANPVVFMLADELGLTGTETAAQIDARTDATAVLEEVRGIFAERLGIVPSAADATALSPGLPKVGFVAPPAEYTGTAGEVVDAESIDLCGRLMSMQTAHRTYMLTGAVCTATAATVDGTVVAEVSRPLERDSSGAYRVRIGHPYGGMTCLATKDDNGDISGVAVERTARAILDGQVHVRHDVFPDGIA